MKIKNAEILCVGTELLLGEVVNTNTAYLGHALSRLGISVYRTCVVGDNPARLRAAVEEALSGADLLIMTGGLGPTYDDLTKETVAELFGLPMVRDEEILRDIEGYFSESGREMPESNKKQADLPRGSVALPNETGTAPGIFLKHGDKVVILLPGPPFENQPMFEKYAAPRLRKMSDGILVSHNIHLMGIGESEAESYLRDIMESSANPTLAPYAKEGEVRLRIGALAPDEESGERMCREMLRAVEESPVGKFIYAVDCPAPEALVIEELRKRGLTICVAESCTGGYLGKRLTDVPGASAAFVGGFITYSNKTKAELLGVSEQTLREHSAVSEQTAREMAEGARARLGADIAVSVTGEAGPLPDPATGAEVGTVFIGIAEKNGTRTVKLKVNGRRGREYIRKVATSRALKEIIVFLQENR